MKDKVSDEKMKQELSKLTKQLSADDKALDESRAKVRELEANEADMQDDLKKANTTIAQLKEQVSDLRGALETMERRMVKSEERFKQMLENHGTSNSTSVVDRGGKSAGGDITEADKSGMDDLRSKRDEFEKLADSRLKEIQGLRAEIVTLHNSKDGAAGQAGGGPQGEVTEQKIRESALFKSLQEQLNSFKKECESSHMSTMSTLSQELVVAHNRVIEERMALEQLHQTQLKTVTHKLLEVETQLEGKSNEIKKLTNKLNEKASEETSASRAEEVDKLLKTLQEQHQRLLQEHKELKQRPDVEEMRRQCREKEEASHKERDIAQISVGDLTQQLKDRDKTIAQLKSSNGINGTDNPLAKELEAVKKDMEALRNEKKDLLRRLQKADRGFKDQNVLYQTVRKDRDALTRDVESLGEAFEEMQEQNQRLLSKMKAKEEEVSSMYEHGWAV
jgi:chromosome segregation ATPase